MKIVERYQVTVYVVHENLSQIVEAIKKVNNFRYGNYKWVHFVSASGKEYYNVLPEAEKNISEDTIHSNDALKIEFSIPRDSNQLNTVLETIISHHPWDEPVIRISEITETRVV